ncbi:hypothetical protein GCK32_011282, partial [Trichostrongylus colubriformis]
FPIYVCIYLFFKKFKSSELAIRLGLCYDDWNGTPIRDLLTSNEHKSWSVGNLKWGSLKLEEILKSEESNSTDTRKISTVPCPTRKRESNATGSSFSKLAKMS